MEKKKEGEKEASEKKGIGVMNIILIIVGVSLLLFTISMIQIFRMYGAVPDTLITCVFAALGGECGIMGWIKTTKDKNKDRQWLLEDRKQEKENVALIQHEAMDQQTGGDGNGSEWG